MAITYRAYQDNRYRKEWQSGHTNFMQRAYIAGQDSTLSGMSLKQGDVLPDDATYYIVSSEIKQDKDGGSRFAVVTAVNFDSGK